MRTSLAAEAPASTYLQELSLVESSLRVVALSLLDKVRIEEQFPRLVQSLSSRRERRSSVELQQAIEKSVEDGFIAGQLRTLALWVQASRKLEIQQRRAALERTVETHLQASKARGEMSGQISKASIERFLLCSPQYSAEWSALVQQEAELDAMVSVFLVLEKQIVARGIALQSQAKMAAGRGDL